MPRSRASKPASRQGDQVAVAASCRVNRCPPKSWSGRSVGDGSGPSWSAIVSCQAGETRETFAYFTRIYEFDIQYLDVTRKIEPLRGE